MEALQRDLKEKNPFSQDLAQLAIVEEGQIVPADLKKYEDLIKDNQFVNVKEPDEIIGVGKMQELDISNTDNVVAKYLSNVFLMTQLNSIAKQLMRQGTLTMDEKELSRLSPGLHMSGLVTKLFMTCDENTFDGFPQTNFKINMNDIPVPNKKLQAAIELGHELPNVREKFTQFKSLINGRWVIDKENRTCNNALKIYHIVTGNKYQQCPKPQDDRNQLLIDSSVRLQLKIYRK